MWRYVVADVETDNLLDTLTVVHSLVIRDLETDEVLSCADQEGYVPIWRGLEVLQNAERIYGHNFIKFDYPALRKVYPSFTLRREQIRDTLVIAQMRWAHIAPMDYERAKQGTFPKKMAGQHSLEAWGMRLGVYKGEYKKWCADNGITEPFKDWRPEMQEYCVGDTATTKALVEHIKKYAPSQESIEIEHELAWYLAAQERAGVPFDTEKAHKLQARWAATREEIAARMRTEFGPLYVKVGKEKVAKKGNKKTGLVAGAEYQNIKLVDFNPGSRPQTVAKLKQLFGWIPTEFTDNGQAKLDEKTLSGLNTDIPAVKSLIEYMLVVKRLGQLAEGEQAWLRLATKGGYEGGKLTGLMHLHGRIKQNHAITHRASHASPNLSAVPKVGKPFGEECRELFYVPDGWVLVGADASSLEARCLAHYLAKYDGGDYGRLLLEGDVHTANRIALGLPGDTPLIAKAARDAAKTWFYAWMYGGGPEKLGSILAFAQLADGTRIMREPKGGWTKPKLKKLGLHAAGSFMDNLPAFKHLIESVKKSTKKQGYVRLPDGRKAYVRSEHSALNTLLQGAGAIIVKRWIANYSPILHETLGEPGWKGQWVPLLWSHDETQTAVRVEHAEFVRGVLVEQMRKITQHYNWRVALDGEAKVGMNWKQTH